MEIFQIANKISSLLGMLSSVTKLPSASHQPTCILVVLIKSYSTCIALGPVHEALKRGENKLVTQPIMQPHLSLLLFGTLIKCVFVTHLIT